MIIGIDLGTTFSAAARITQSGIATIIPNRDGERLTPSVVLVEENKLLVGSKAIDGSMEDNQTLVRYIKRHMGEKSYEIIADDDGRIIYKPEQISAAILRQIVEDCEKYTGERVEGAVITVPAYFNDKRRMATRQAGEIAGIKVLALINEPTAAALAYGVHSNKEETVMVFDLGGGTFDVTIEKIAPGEIKVIASGGDCNLGGVNFDDALIRHAQETFKSQLGIDIRGDQEALSLLRLSCEGLKKQLSANTVAEIVVRAKGRGIRLRVTRDEFEEMIEPIVHRAMLRVDGVLKDAGMRANQLDRILMVGGSTKIPYVRSELERYCRQTLSTDEINPDEAVAMGAAYYAQLIGQGSNPTECNAQTVDEDDGDEVYVRSSHLPASAPERQESTSQEPQRRFGIKGQVEQERRMGLQGNVVRDEMLIPSFTDVTSHGYGIKAFDFESGRFENCIMIPRNTPLPASRTQTFFTTENGQTSISVEVTEGNETDIRYVSIIGTMEAPFERSYHKGVPIQITITCNADGMIEVSAFDANRGVQLNNTRITRKASLNQHDVSEMTQQMKNSILL